MGLHAASSRSAEMFWLVNQGALYPLLLKLENEGSIASEWCASENNAAPLLSPYRVRPETVADRDP
jgi:DNA-binding PadR family transcriptional regulator